MSFDNPVRRLRQTLGLNQIDFGRLIGKSNATVRNYEGGIAIPPEVLDRLKTLAAEKGLADIALELSGEDWQVRTVVYPLKPPAAGSPLPAPARGSARWHAVVDAMLGDPSFGPVLTALIAAFERTKPEPQTRKAGKQ